MRAHQSNSIKRTFCCKQSSNSDRNNANYSRFLSVYLFSASLATFEYRCIILSTIIENQRKAVSYVTTYTRMYYVYVLRYLEFCYFRKFFDKKFYRYTQAESRSLIV